MKTFQKIMLLLALCLCAAGIVASGTAFAVSGFRPYNLIPEEQKMLEKTYETNISEIGQIDILTENRPVIIIPVKTDQLKITYKVRKLNTILPEFTLTDNGSGKKAFCMDYRDAEREWKLLRITFLTFDWDNVIRVYLPESYLADIHISTTNARVTANGLHTDGTLSLDTTNGRITVSGSSAAILSAHTTNGSIQLNSCTASGNITAGTTNASVTLEDCKTAGTISAKSSNGKITADKLEAEALELTTTNGSLHLEDMKLNQALKAQTTNGSLSCTNITAKKADVQTTNGSVTLNEVSSADLTATSRNGAIRVSRISGSNISLQTVNGSVSGTILGDIDDYNIISDTTNGSNKLPSRFHENADKKLVIKTSNASIKVSFE